MNGEGLVGLLRLIVGSVWMCVCSWSDCVDIIRVFLDDVSALLLHMFVVCVYFMMDCCTHLYVFGDLLKIAIHVCVCLMMCLW